ncbi:hypothetical protein H5410_044173 [Solanum commersonii]|uniref:Uncharacterized protein n=1 Tax=Solanum commersonii TaxID=4109 RepID=A0A9J5X6E2_SOLCO|nr:hypothetical protein H5410_044173 [Solanum commersonii]
MWNLLMKRNHIKHGDQSTFEELVQQVEMSIQLMVMVNNLEFKTTRKSWPEMVKIMGAYKPRIYYQIVQWKLPEEDQLKCNIDGASKENPWEKSGGRVEQKGTKPIGEDDEARGFNDYRKGAYGRQGQKRKVRE